MGYLLSGSLSLLILMMGVLLCMEIGRAIGARQRARDPEHAREGLGTIDGAVFGLMALLLAFTFDGAGARFDSRRELIVEEANAIGTAYLRIDLLPPARQPLIREGFRKYLDSRLRIYRLIPDEDAVAKELEHSITLQERIWADATAAVAETQNPQLMLMVLSPLNIMFDIASARMAATLMHPPEVLFVMLAVLAFASALLAGNAMAASPRRSWMHILIFAVLLSVTICVTLDLEFPRVGFIRITRFDEVLRDVRARMH